MSAEASSLAQRGAHFGSRRARQEAAHLAMWVFLGTEVLLFAGLLCAFAVARSDYPDVFEAARHHMDVTLGTVNTYLLVTSSTLVALSTWAVRHGRRRLGVGLLAGAAGLGVGFLCVKALEYSHHISEGALPGAGYHLAGFMVAGAGLYFTLYFLLTGLHAVHVTGGVVVLLVTAARVRSGTVSASYLTPLELGGMYWHLVDVVWLFLWPLLYLT